MERRNDYPKAALINGILLADAWRGKSYSARALYDIRVPLEDAIRLLTRPKERRHYLAPAEFELHDPKQPVKR